MAATPRIVGLGEVLWDVFPHERYLGGAPMNVAVHAQGLGCAGAVISAVGDDELGREALRRLQDHGVDVRAMEVRADRPTGSVMVQLTGGQPTYTFTPEVAWDDLRVTDAARDVAQHADAIVFGTLAQRSVASRTAISKLLALARPAAWKVFDVNLRPPHWTAEAIRGSLPVAHVLKLNDAEVSPVLEALGTPIGRDWPFALFSRFPQLRLVALTKGEQGSSLFPREGVADVLSAEPVPVADTVGAGDAFTAALVRGLTLDQPLNVTHRQASRCAAFVCSQRGATPILPTDLTTR